MDPSSMTGQRWSRTCQYLREVFGTQDAPLASIRDQAVTAGLPDIAVSPETGAFLSLLASLAASDRRATGLAFEVGTLAGYSAIWLARGLARGLPAGVVPRLITLEIDARHAEFARARIEDAGLRNAVEVRVGPALESLAGLGAELGLGGADLVFLDAAKTEYPRYLELAVPLLRPGGLLLADNALGSRFWIDDPPGDPDRDAVDRFNRAAAGHSELTAACVPIGHGVLVARKNELSRQTVFS